MLVAAEGARVVSLSSRGHQIAGVDFADIDFRYGPYDKWMAYGQSKTANALFAVALGSRLNGSSMRRGRQGRARRDSSCFRRFIVSAMMKGDLVDVWDRQRTGGFKRASAKNRHHQNRAQTAYRPNPVWHYFGRFLGLIHRRQCGHRTGVGRSSTAIMAARIAGRVGCGGGPWILLSVSPV